MANVGDVIEGTVKNAAKPGIFVDIGGEEGMIPHDQVNQQLNPGDKVRVRVSKIRDDGKIRLAIVGATTKTQSDNKSAKAGNPDWRRLGDSFYSDKANGVLNEELFTVFAKKLAEESANARDKELTTNALRNFYDAVKAIENPILQAGSRSEKRKVFARQLPHIKLLAAKVAHYRPEKSPKIPKVFADFLDDSIKIINSLEEFEGFVLVFEAVAGWHTKFAKKGDN